MRKSALAAVALTLAGQAAHAVSYTVTLIETAPTGPGIGTVAYGLNNLGQVTGYDANGVAFIWQSGVTTPVYGPYAPSRGHDINDSGQIALAGPSIPGVTYRWTNGVSTPLNSLPIGLGPGQADRVFGINSQGWIVGDSLSFGTNYPTLWIETAAQALCGSTGVARAVNDVGQVTGQQCGGPGFVWQSGVGLTPLPISGNDINNAGVVAGQAPAAPADSCNRAAIWFGGATTILTPNDCGEASAINEAGQVVGIFRSPELDAPFVWDQVNGLQLLTSVVITGTGEMLLAATSDMDINEQGQILLNGRSSLTNTDISVLLTPVPMPPALWLFGSALGVMGWMRRRVAI